MLTVVNRGRWVILKDLETIGFLTQKDAGDDLWSILHYQYSRTGRNDYLPMVRGRFLTSGGPASGSE